MEATHAREADGSETPLPRYEHHMLCDEYGQFPAEMNDWEREVLKVEMTREGFQAWYRNPSRACPESLGVAYNGNDQVKLVRPDFIFFVKQSDGSFAADIVDPHGTHFSDALAKLQGLAYYAEKHSEVYRRIEGIAKAGDKLRVLDLTDSSVRKAVAEAADARSLYQSEFASDY